MMSSNERNRSQQQQEQQSHQKQQQQQPQLLPSCLIEDDDDDFHDDDHHYGDHDDDDDDDGINEKCLYHNNKDSIISNNNKNAKYDSKKTTTNNHNSSNVFDNVIMTMDIYYSIFSYLTFHDIMLSQLYVSKSWMRSILYNDYLWKFLFTRQYNITSQYDNMNTNTNTKNTATATTSTAYQSSSSSLCSSSSSYSIWYHRYKEAYQNPNDIWITHWNCIYPDQSLCPGRTYIPSASASSSTTTSFNYSPISRHALFRDLCPHCRYNNENDDENDSYDRDDDDDDDDEKVQRKYDPDDNPWKQILTTSTAQTMAYATDTYRQKQLNHNGRRRNSYSTHRRNRCIKAFQQASIIHKDKDNHSDRDHSSFTKQYEDTNINFLSDLLFFPINDKNNSDESSSSSFSPPNQEVLTTNTTTTNTARIPTITAINIKTTSSIPTLTNHSWHIIKFYNPDYYRIIHYQIYLNDHNFTVYPSCGYINPGECHFVTIGYSTGSTSTTSTDNNTNTNDRMNNNNDNHPHQQPIQPIMIQYHYCCIYPDDGTTSGTSISSSTTSNHHNYNHKVTIQRILKEHHEEGLKKKKMSERTNNDNDNGVSQSSVTHQYMNSQQPLSSTTLSSSTSSRPVLSTHHDHHHKKIHNNQNGNDSVDDSILDAQYQKYHYMMHDYYSQSSSSSSNTTPPIQYMKKLYLKAHVHHNYYYQDFIRHTLQPWDIKTYTSSSSSNQNHHLNINMAPPIYHSPIIRELYPYTYQQLQCIPPAKYVCNIGNDDGGDRDSNCDNRDHYSGGTEQRTQLDEGPCMNCCNYWGLRDEELYHVYEVAIGESVWYQKQRRTLLNNIIMSLHTIRKNWSDILLSSSITSIARISHWLDIIHPIVQSYIVSPNFLSKQQKILQQMNHFIIHTYQQMLSIHHQNLINISKLSSSFWLLPWNRSDDILSMQKKVYDYNVRKNSIVEISTASKTKKKNDDDDDDDTTDMYHDDIISTFTAGLCMIRNPRCSRFISNHIYDEIPYPGTVSYQRKIIQHLQERKKCMIVDNDDENTSDMKKKIKINVNDSSSNRKPTEVIFPKLFTSKERITFYQLQKGFDMKTIADTDHAHMNDYYDNIFAEDCSRSDDQVITGSIPSLGVNYFPNNLHGNNDHKVIISLPFENSLKHRVNYHRNHHHRFKDEQPGSILPFLARNNEHHQHHDNNNNNNDHVALEVDDDFGIRWFRLLRRLGARLGLAIVDNNTSSSLYVDRTLLISTQWLCISFMIVPMIQISLARYYHWIPTQPIEYSLEHIPLTITNKMRYATDKECGGYALLLFMSWLIIGRWIERYTSRDYFRVMQDHIITTPPKRHGQRSRWRIFPLFHLDCNIIQSITVFAQRLHDPFFPLFVQRIILLVPYWNRRTKYDLFKHINYWRIRCHDDNTNSKTAKRSYTLSSGTWLFFKHKQPKLTKQQFSNRRHRLPKKEFDMISRYIYDYYQFDFGTITRARKLIVGFVVAITTFMFTSSHFWFNFMSIFSCSISLGMNITITSLEINSYAGTINHNDNHRDNRTNNNNHPNENRNHDNNDNINPNNNNNNINNPNNNNNHNQHNFGSIYLLKDVSLITVIILSCLMGQLVGSSGGAMFLAEFVVTSIGLLLGGAGTISTSSMESWGCLIFLSIMSFWGYLLGRVGLMDNIRHRSSATIIDHRAAISSTSSPYSSKLLFHVIIFLFLFWLFIFFMTQSEFPVSVMIIRPTTHDPLFKHHHLSPTKKAHMLQ